MAIPYSFANLVEPLLPAVVNISTTTIIQGWKNDQLPLDIPIPNGSPLEDFFEKFFEQMQPEISKNLTALGSGFIIDSKGHIVTNSHLIEDADKITVILNDNTELKATIVGKDQRTDIAVLKVDYHKKLPFVQWGATEKLRVGDYVVAIGNPFGLGGTVTAGIVSYLARDIDRSVDLIQGYIQTDASINLGSSGGPMFDMEGKVVGINTAIYSPAGNNVGIGFAIPSEIAKKAVKQILLYGRIKRGWLGVSTQFITKDIAEGLGLKDLKGALIRNVVKDGPAAKAQLQAGDVILKIGNKDVRDQRSLPRIVGDFSVGSQVEVIIFRKGKTLFIPVRIGEYEEGEEAGIILSPEREKELARSVKIHGMYLQALTDNLRKRFDINPDIEGILVVDVEPKSSAAENGVRPGDIVMEISQEQVKTPQQAVNLFKKAVQENRKIILLLINRNSDKFYSPINISPRLNNKR